MDTSRGEGAAVLAAVITDLYESFSRGDADGMAACYHPQVHFSDPVFPDLNGPQVMQMWEALLGRSTDLHVVAGPANAEAGSTDGAGTGRTHWTATYTFAATGRPVVNEIDAEFRFEDGLIREHRDSFGFWRWTRMALGAPGLLLGWSPPLRSRVRRDAAKLLRP